MKDYKKILQLDSEGKSKNEISQCLGYQWRTISDILKKAEAAKITYDQAKLLDNKTLQKRIAKPRKTDDDYLEVDLEYLHRELVDPHVTMQQLYEVYQQRAESLKKRPIPKVSLQRYIRTSQQKRRFLAMSKASLAKSWNWILQGMHFLILTGA